VVPYVALVINPLPDHERKKLQRRNSGIIQHTPHEAQYSSYPVVLTFAIHSKKSRNLSVQPILRGITSASDEKLRPFNCFFFQSRKKVVVRRGQNRRIESVTKTLGAQVGQIILGCKCPVCQGIVLQEQDPFGDIRAPFFVQNVLQFDQQRLVILRFVS